ncbi:succinate dehydrogenase cytochrome b subunit [Pseudanabaena sp. FACHB-2040]|uniref:succinate dehydrogenase cytochrome b subunit n=1 Tax=Pseudanabaena sp. FACHB-2040 TaxID=2692859 RepID=UPI001684FFC1|nr:succinate dehydrogenase cytochrome b subunit [Pseudanabaena sp. FACHB-2040]MBD2257016.1 succinate dehydrogenase cytochrome b subunit [Pseudanabaena sp. FACHB-2040]
MTDVLRSPSTESSAPAQEPRLYQSPIGKKLLSAVTGLGLAIFVLVHMLGNLILFTGSNAYNQYARHLEDWGVLLYVIEAGLLVFVLVHAGLGIQIYLNRLKARPVHYQKYASAGSPSLQSLSSRTMIFTGITLAVFLVFHLTSFKFGAYYDAEFGGVPGRDLARLVFEKFHEPMYAFGYPAVMVLLGFHLRHGIWSALQSLGAMSKSIRPLVYALSTVLAALIAAGFIALPLAIYFNLLS